MLWDFLSAVYRSHTTTGPSIARRPHCVGSTAARNTSNYPHRLATGSVPVANSLKTNKSFRFDLPFWPAGASKALFGNFFFVCVCWSILNELTEPSNIACHENLISLISQDVALSGAEFFELTLRHQHLQHDRHARAP